MKTLLATLALALSLLSADAFAVAGPGAGGTAGPAGPAGGSSPAAASAPSTPRDGPDTVYFELARKTQNPGFCDRYPSDVFVKANLVRCTGY
jgi:hypothetical protein